MNNRIFVTGVFAAVLSIAVPGIVQHKSLAHQDAKLIKQESLQIKLNKQFGSIAEQVKKNDGSRLEVINRKSSKEDGVKLFVKSEEHLIAKLEDKRAEKVGDQKSEKNAYKLEEKLINDEVAKADHDKTAKVHNKAVIKSDDKTTGKSDDDTVKNGEYETVVKKADHVKAENAKNDGFNVHLENHPNKG